MEIAPFFFKVCKIDEDCVPIAYLGMAVPITPDGGMLTARHVVDVDLAEDERLALVDHDGQRSFPIETKLLSADGSLDLAYIASTSLRGKGEYFPVLEPAHIQMGLDVYTFGHYLPAGNRTETRHGQFKGHIVNVTDTMANGHAGLTLSYPILEGLSGSAVLTYHNGVKIVGLAVGNASSQIVAHEYADYTNSGKDIHEKETIKRVVELGQAHRAPAIMGFAREHSLPITVTSERAEIPGLT